jgi:hypothetical protein
VFEWFFPAKSSRICLKMNTFAADFLKATSDECQTEYSS